MFYKVDLLNNIALYQSDNTIIVLFTLNNDRKSKKLLFFLLCFHVRPDIH
jgi:hypothetical protein